MYTHLKLFYQDYKKNYQKRPLKLLKTLPTAQLSKKQRQKP